MLLVELEERKADEAAQSPSPLQLALPYGITSFAGLLLPEYF